MTQHRASATATREGRWWVVDLGDLGTTQGRTAKEAHSMATDLVASMLDTEPEHVTVDLQFQLPGQLGVEVVVAREATQHAAEAQEKAAHKSRKAVADMKANGLSGADIAAVLGLTPQRVSQLLKDTTARC